jgi:hypothetical protein
VKFKKYRVKKEFIYENNDLKDTRLARKAFELGYAFYKWGQSYYMLSVKEYKSKPSMIEGTLVELEVVE